MIANSGHDENWNISGGKAGDQGGEFEIRSWYDRPWDCVLVHPNVNVRKEIVRLATDAAKNDSIGYDQSQRIDFWEQLKVVQYEPKRIKSPCEADCSSGVCAIVKSVGYLLGIPELKAIDPNLSTWYMKDAFRQAGFEVWTDKKYLTSDQHIPAGAILLNVAKHTCINLDDGIYWNNSNKTTQNSNKTTQNSKINSNKQTKTKINKVGIATAQDNSLIGSYRVAASSLALRTGAGTDYDMIADMPNGAEVICYAGYYDVADGHKWLYVGYGNQQGFCCGKYLHKV